MDSVEWLNNNPLTVSKRIITSFSPYYGESKVKEGFAIHDAKKKTVRRIEKYSELKARLSESGKLEEFLQKNKERCRQRRAMIKEQNRLKKLAESN
jgi:hypothetical protein